MKSGLNELKLMFFREIVQRNRYFQELVQHKIKRDYEAITTFFDDYLLDNNICFFTSGRL